MLREKLKWEGVDLRSKTQELQRGKDTRSPPVKTAVRA